VRWAIGASFRGVSIFGTWSAFFGCSVSRCDWDNRPPFAANRSDWDNRPPDNGVQRQTIFKLDLPALCLYRYQP
jgi:hypothetical protein